MAHVLWMSVVLHALHQCWCSFACIASVLVYAPCVYITSYHALHQCWCMLHVCTSLHTMHCISVGVCSMCVHHFIPCIASVLVYAPCVYITSYHALHQCWCMLHVCTSLHTMHCISVGVCSMCVHHFIP